MRCLHCDREIDDDLKVCPYCDHEISDADKELELPQLSEEELGKTMAISKEEETSLIDDINKEIERSSDDAEEESEEAVLSTKDSYKTRRAVLGFCVLITMAIIVVTTVILTVNHKRTTSVEAENYMVSYEKALKVYYETDDIDDIIVLLQKNKDDAKVIEEFQEKTRVTCDSWLLLYVSEKVNTAEEFEEVTKRYENFLLGLNKYAVVKNDDGEVKALTDSDYLELSNQLNGIYDDSIVFFDALKVYNAKDYNKAYYLFARILSTNTYYDKAQYYLSKIIDNVLEILKSDIAKLEQDIDSLSDEDKLVRYSQIEEIINGYNDAYMGLNLSANKEYSDLLTNYKNKINELSNKGENPENE